MLVTGHTKNLCDFTIAPKTCSHPWKQATPPLPMAWFVREKSSPENTGFQVCPHDFVLGLDPANFSLIPIHWAKKNLSLAFPGDFPINFPHGNKHWGWTPTTAQERDPRGRRDPSRLIWRECGGRSFSLEEHMHMLHSYNQNIHILYIYIYGGVSWNRDIPKWMVYKGNSY